MSWWMTAPREQWAQAVRAQEPRLRKLTADSRMTISTAHVERLNRKQQQRKDEDDTL